MQLVLKGCTIRPWRLDDTESRRLRTIQLRRVCWKRPVSFSKDAWRRTLSKTKSSSIHCPTRRRR